MEIEGQLIWITTEGGRLSLGFAVDDTQSVIKKLLEWSTYRNDQATVCCLMETLLRHDDPGVRATCVDAVVEALAMFTTATNIQSVGMELLVRMPKFTDFSHDELDPIVNNILDHFPTEEIIMSRTIVLMQRLINQPNTRWPNLGVWEQKIKGLHETTSNELLKTLSSLFLGSEKGRR